MAFNKQARSTVAFIVISCLLFAAAVQAQQKQLQELRAKLFNQVLSDFKDVRECLEQEEGGLRTAQDNMNFEEFDLNRDGVDEYEVELSGPCSCGMVNCSIYIYRKAGQGFESILDDAAGYGVEMLKTSTNGYRDLLVTARDTAATQSQITYKFDGKQYREAKNMLVHVETGETKPAVRRLQFKRGTSQTTVQGKVSIALPDTYLVGARAGQVMTIKLTAQRKAVRFLLMSPSTRSLVADNARDWTGVLEETGDYTIIIDSDERNSVYSMAVSIK
ncbi:MAG TPA: hypothetical protein VLB46_13655 [Pyrinomonadaceae bacterium]|nr:hypothetical protein [Pyrinomonadaceae bacterium]